MKLGLLNTIEKYRKSGRPEGNYLLYKMPETEAEAEVCFMKLN